MNKSQKQLILEHMQNGHKITPIDALKLYGCFRLANVIFELRNEGYDIATDMVKNQNNKEFASYRLMSDDGELNLGLTKSYQYPD